MDLGLAGKTIFVAGSSRGIGLGIADIFLQEGANVVITGRDAAALEKTRVDLSAKYGAEKILAFSGDLGLAETLNAAFAKTGTQFGGLDHVVINVGSGRSTVPGWDVPQTEWDRVFQINLWTSVQIAQEAMRSLEKTGGSITLISSIAGITSMAAPLAYSAAKAALTNYSANLSVLGAPHGVRVNCVAPGNTLFEGGTWDKRLQERENETRDYIQKVVPLNRFGTIEDIGNIVAFLASERSGFVTGACWVADGGQIRKF